jgi:prepilin-type N-terminal cleavage/methylation domain-containing protein
MRRTQRGFSMIELMVAIFVMTVIVGVAFQQINQVQQRAQMENAKLDMFQEAREFMDQLVRDLHQAGYPSIKQFDTSSWSTAVSSPSYNDARLATGLIYIAPDEIEFEGDVDGTGTVSILDYKLFSSGDNCPCLKRSQVAKSTSPGTNYSVEVQNVQNAGTTSDPIFVAYKNDGTLVNNADMTSSANRLTLANIRSVQITLKLKSKFVDQSTHQAPETTLGSSVAIVNCSLAASGGVMSCQ